MSDSQRSGVLAVMSAMTPVVVAALGAWFTNTYKMQEVEANRIAAERLELDRQQRLLIDKASVVKQYFDYLANKADANQQTAALAVLVTLGYTDLVAKVVVTNPSVSNVQALAAIGATGDGATANTVVGALESISGKNSSSEISEAVEAALTTTQAASVSAGSTVVVAGADKTLDGAKFEVDKLKQAGVENAQIVKKGDWYRTVVPLENVEDRASTLNQIKTTINRSAYEVNYEKWCGAEGAACTVSAP